MIAGESLLINCLLGGESRNVTFYLNNKPVHYGGDSGRYQKAKVTGADQGIIKCVNHHVKLDMTASASAQVVVYGRHSVRACVCACACPKAKL